MSQLIEGWVGEFMPDNPNRGRVYVPDVRIEKLEPNMFPVAQRGYATNVAVMQNDRYIGWCRVELLGFTSVKEWLAKGERFCAGCRAPMYEHTEPHCKRCVDKALGELGFDEVSDEDNF